MSKVAQDLDWEEMDASGPRNTMSLALYDEAKRSLQLAATIDEAKEWRDKAAALAAYAKQQKNSEMENWVMEIKIRAALRIGEISLELEKGTAGRPSQEIVPSGGHNFKTATLRAAGISHGTAHRYERLAEHKDLVEAYIGKKKTANKPIKFAEVLVAVESALREERASDELYSYKPITLAGLYHGDFRDLSNSIEDRSVELIFTDPPYDRDSIQLFEDIARIGSRILKPGGSVISYCGQIQLPQVLTLMSKHLRYWWLNACVHSGQTALRMNKYGIVNQWKPMVWFVNGSRGDVQSFVDDAVSGGIEKSHHKWQQAESEAAYYIDNLTSADGVVVDFCAGGGTTCAAAESLGRKWVAFDVDKNAINIINKRMSGDVQ